MINEIQINIVAKIFTQYMERLSVEGDRSCVIISSVMIENELEKLIKLRLVCSLTPNDELFSGANAPLGSFSAKISLAYRIGILSKEEKHIFDQLRKLRNKCAHEIDKDSFESYCFIDITKNIINSDLRLWNSILKTVNDVKNDNSKFDSSDELIKNIGLRRAFQMTVCILIAQMKFYAENVKIEKLNKILTLV